MAMSAVSYAGGGGKVKNGFLDLIISAIDEEDKQRIINAFQQKESLLDTEVLEAYLGGQPILLSLCLSLLLLSALSSAVAVALTSCRAAGRCGGKRYQPHPTSGSRFVLLLMCFLLCWLLLSSATMHFVLSTAAFCSQRNPTQLISVPLRMPVEYPDYEGGRGRGRREAESLLAQLFDDPDYTGDFENLQDDSDTGLVEASKAKERQEVLTQPTTSAPSLRFSTGAHSNRPLSPSFHNSFPSPPPMPQEVLPSEEQKESEGEIEEEDEEVLDGEEEDEQRFAEPLLHLPSAPSSTSLPSSPRWIANEAWRSVIRKEDRDRIFVDPTPASPRTVTETPSARFLSESYLPPSLPSLPPAPHFLPSQPPPTALHASPIRIVAPLTTTPKSETTWTPTTFPSAEKWIAQTTTTPVPTTTTSAALITSPETPRVPPFSMTTSPPVTPLPPFTRVSPSIVLSSFTSSRPSDESETLLEEDVRLLQAISPLGGVPDYVSINALEDAIPVQIGTVPHTKERRTEGSRTGFPAVSLLSHRRRFVSLHSTGFRLLHRFFGILLSLFLSLATLPSLLLVLIGSMCYARSYHPMDRSRVSDRVGVLCVVTGLGLLFLLPLLLFHSSLGLLLSHAHHAICPLVQPPAETVEEILMTLEGCSRVQLPLVRMWQSSLLASLAVFPLAVLLLQLSAYFLRMRTEHYWTQPEQIRYQPTQAYFM